MNMIITDILRRIENVIRVGVISAVNNDHCRVKTGNIETDWIKWMVPRAGDDVEWWPPSIGEQVVLLCLSGELTTAFALLSVYSDSAPPPSLSSAERVVKFSDGANVRYDKSSHTLTIDNVVNVIITGAENVTINASAGITLNTPIVTCSDSLIAKSITTGQLSVTKGGTMNGNITHSGGAISSNGIVLDNHKHGDVTRGDSQTGGPV